MKIIVTHTSPDWDAIGGVWLLRKYLPGWDEAVVRFVPAGQRLPGAKLEAPSGTGDPIEKIGEDEIVHVDTGMGPLDHHQTADKDTSGTSLAWNFVKTKHPEFANPSDKMKVRMEAVDRIVRFIIDTDHFKEVFWPDAAADRYEFSLLGVLDGMKLMKPDADDYYMTHGTLMLEALLHQFENRIWAEEEIKKAISFQTRWGEGLAFGTINDMVLKLAQKQGYRLVVRKDPRKGYVRIKARPTDEVTNSKLGVQSSQEIDLTLAYEKLRKIDPDATWFLHASRKMLLNGTPKNPKMIPTKLTLEQIVEVLKGI